MNDKDKNKNIVLCGANYYDKKYYFNDSFSILPQKIRDELQITCVTFTEQCGGILILEFDPEGNLEIRTEAEPADAMYDDIGAGLAVEGKCAVAVLSEGNKGKSSVGLVGKGNAGCVHSRPFKLADYLATERVAAELREHP